MANYGINIELNIKKQQKLNELNKQLDATGNKIDGASKSIRKLLGDQDALIRSYNDLNRILRDANKEFNRVALGTPQAKEAARNLVNVNNEVNKGLEERAKLLKQVSTEMAYQEKMAKLREKGIRPRTAYSSPIGPMQMMTVNNNPRIMRNIAASQAARGGSGFGAFSESIRGGGIFPTKQLDAVTKSINRHAKNISRNIGTIVKLQTQQVSGAFTALPGGDFGISGGQIGPRLPLINRLGFGKRAQGGPFAMQGGGMGRLKGGVGSALIGGGFPALFGAGGISSAFGAIAGGAGGALAPGGGFAASIFATAIAAQIEKAIAFNKAVDDLNVSIKATGGTSLFSSKQVAEFAKSLGMTKDEALEALKAFKQFEASARIALTQTFGSEGTFDIFAGLKDNASIINALPGLSKELSLSQAQRALETLKTKGATAAEDQLLGNILDKNNEIIKQEAIKLNFLQRQLSKLNPFRGKGISALNLFSPTGGSLTMEEAGELRGEEALENQRKQNAIALKKLEIQRNFNEELERQAIIKAPVDELNRLIDPLTQIDALGKSIGDSFSESFKGLIRGSMTAQQALANLFQRTADHFLDMAAQMLAAQIRSGIFGLFSSFINPTFGTGIPSGANLLPGSFGTGTAGGVGATANDLTRHLANGGVAQANKTYMVGERGPELFTPGATGTVTPNHVMGSTNIVVNVDASGTSVEGDQPNAEELGRLIGAVVQSELIKEKRPGGLLA